MWWGYNEWAGKRFVGTEDNWSFGYDLDNKNVKAMNPDDLVSTHKGKKEQAAVTPAQHPSSLVGKSWRRETGQPQLNEYDRVDSAYVPWLGKTVKNPEGYGIYFQDRWNEVLKTDLEMGNKRLDFEFKWSDNMQNDDDPLDWYVNGDMAPGGRFNYIYTVGVQ